MRVELTPIFGARGPGPLCSLLTVDGARILLDAGWSDALEAEGGPPTPGADVGGEPAPAVAAALAAASTAHALLLSHADMEHVGALAAIVAALPPTSPVLATVPVHRLGQLVLYDAARSRARAAVRPPPGVPADGDLAAVDAAFARVTVLRYAQRYVLKIDTSATDTDEGDDAMDGGDDDSSTATPFSLTLTPRPAGVTMGGAVWEVATPGGATILYAPAVNHARERLLDAAGLGAVPSRGARAALLVAGVPPAASAPPRPPPAADAWIVDTLLAALRRDGCVLVPAPTAGRALDLIVGLDAAWTARRLPYPLALASPVAFSALEFARSQLEWTGAVLSSAFDAGRDNPLACRAVTPCHTLADVDRLPPGPKCVVATLDSLDAGLARDLFLRWAPDPRCAIVWPAPPPAGSTAAALLERAAAAGGAEVVLDLTVAHRVPLEGEALEAWRKEQDAASAAPHPHAHNPPRVDADAVDTVLRPHAGDDTAASAATAPPPAPDTAALAALDAATVGASDVLVDGFVPPADAVAPMFPDEGGAWPGDGGGGARTWDEYGALSLPGDVKHEADGAMGAMGGGGDRGGGGRGRGRARGRGPSSRGRRDDDDELAPLPARPPVVAEPPAKTVLAPARLPVRARLAVGDARGRADARGLRNIVAAVAPLHCVLLGASTDELAALAASVAGDGGAGTVATPADGDTADASAGAASFRVALSDAALASVSLTPCGGGAEAGWLDAVLAPPAAPGEALAALPAAERAAARGGALVGDVRLSDLRAALGAAGVPSAFAAGGGALVCAGRVVVRRSAPAAAAAQELVVEGPLCDEYFVVRDVLYKQFSQAGAAV